MAKHSYKTRVRVENGTEEIQFEPLDEDAPRIPSRYRYDKAEFGKFGNGRTYKVDPDKVEAEAEEELAEAQIKQAKEEVKGMKAATKEGRK